MPLGNLVVVLGLDRVEFDFVSLAKIKESLVACMVKHSQLIRIPVLRVDLFEAVLTWLE